MASILMASGFKNLESLQDFSNRFPNVSVHLDSDLLKIWVCHKNPGNIPINEEINLLPCEDYFSLSKKIKKKLIAGKQFNNLLSEYSAFAIFNKIYSEFKNQLSTYLFMNCYLFYNWGINAFEPVIDHYEIHSIIQKKQEQSFKSCRRTMGQIFINHINFVENPRNQNKGESCEKNKKIIGLLEEPLSSNKETKIVSFGSVIEAAKKTEKFSDILKNSKNSYHETFCLKKILYDLKERPPWPRNHVLSKNSVQDLILFIIQVPVVTNHPIERKLLNECQNWEVLRKSLSTFIENHQKIVKYDGYGRILKKHLKSVKTPLGRMLHPIPKSIVCSYVLDILRKVLPMELFGKNYLRKSFFSGTIKVIKANKGENFIWYPLLRSLLKNKSDFPWCAPIVETGSSGFGLRYYRKSDMERASSVCLKSLLQKGHIRRLKKKDFDGSSLERKWLNTGIIDEKDVERKLKKTMTSDEEYKQSVAHVRFLPKSDGGDELRIITNIVRKPSRTCRLNSKNKKCEKYFTARLCRRKKNLFLVKLFLEFLVDKIGFGFKPLPCNPRLEEAWKKAVHLKEKSGKLFYVKADISDAFDSVKYDVLSGVLRSAFEKEAELGNVQLMKIIEWRKMNGRIQKTARLSFGSRPRENSVMINRSLLLHHNEKLHQYLDLKFLPIIEQVVMQQKIEVKGKIFKLMKGLAQGSAGKFSPQLCEIYYSSIDRLFFGEFIDSNDSIFLRGVDDYLFVTSDVEKAKRFFELVTHGFSDYSIRFNGNKLKSNVFEDIQEVSYLGLTFNFNDMSVKPNYSKYQQRNYLTTINLLDKWGNNHFNKQLFLQRRLLSLECLKLRSRVINGIHNNLKTMRQIVFEASLLQSLRVVTVANYLYSGSAKNDLVVYQILLISNSKIRKVVTSREISTEEVNWLFFFAALNILRKYSGQFKLLLLIIRFRLQQCEKKFVKNDSQLLYKFLKDDILDQEYWKKVRNTFRLFGKFRVKTATSC